MEYENYDEGWYCENCDRSFDDNDFLMAPVGQWWERFQCPHCGQLSEKVVKSDRFYELALYLLSVADDDFVWPDYAPAFGY